MVDISPFFFVLGAIFGSFANVLIYRLPNDQSVVFPGSHCRACGRPIRWYDNVPLLSWFLLGGKCRQCKAKISWRYPLVEFLTGLLFWAVYHEVGWSWTLLEYLIFVFGLVVVTFIDFDHMILPDEFTLSGVALGLIGAVINPERNFVDALIGVIVGGGLLWLVAFVYFRLRGEEGMGGGDIKLLAWIGAVLGWQAIPFVILVSSLVGLAVGLVYVVKTQSNLKAAIPFGPYLALGGVLYIFLREHLTPFFSL